MAQLSIHRRPVRRRRTLAGLLGLADDFIMPEGFSFDAMSAEQADFARQDVPANIGSPDYSYSAPSGGDLSSSPINWDKMLPSILSAGVDIFKVSTAGETQQAQAGYGIAPPGYTYRGQAYNVQSSYGSSAPSGYSPVYGQPYAQAAYTPQAAGMSSGTLLLLLGGAAIVMMSRKK